MAQNDNLLSYLAGKVYVSTVPVWIPTYTIGTNDDDVVAYLEWNCSFQRLWWVEWLSIEKNFTAKQATIRGDECDYIESKYSRPEITIKFDWLQNIDFDVIDIITWIPVQSVASAPVVITNESHWTGWTVWKPIKLNNKDGDNTLVTVTTIKNNSTTLASWTDYNTYVWDWTNGDLGYSYIVPITAQTWAITANYTYTPLATKYSWIISNTIQLPQLVVKILGCADSSALYNTHYLVNASIGWSITHWFVDLAQAGWAVKSPISFVVNKWGFIVDQIERL